MNKEQIVKRKHFPPKRLNRRWIHYHLCEAETELKRTIREIKKSEYTEESYVVAMMHTYHHLNNAWNARHATDERQRKCAQRDFDRWRKFPDEGEVLLDG